MNLTRALGLRKAVALEILDKFWPEGAALLLQGLAAQAAEAPRGDQVVVLKAEHERAVAERDKVFQDLRLAHRREFPHAVGSDLSDARVLADIMLATTCHGIEAERSGE